ncbi:GlsB/YeaQ/YmgE family stress response membrane protein [Microbaculum marinisediminis]|uniref:GlsB/YeaQ/YmgE family stress response membrane protein n=1 Tax=Microbaculum marinisediminis TaxID=2931392 RepID=A0AAW5R573_9HYPH|nr:GlsB/YeaQ/YmgE family stress response membrane protein [Microbaculum sp. A6E488]MCT8974542.1 GlsB/YeaQ/YmgE family stress response membrane protein [Microbaculum sp. A6E488]
MGIESIVSLLVIGAVAGWLAGLIMQGRGFGVIGNIAVGIVGALIGTYVLGALGIMIGGTWVSAIINSVIGAVILLFIIGLVKKA